MTAASGRRWLIGGAAAYLTLVLVVPMLTLIVETIRAGIPAVLRELGQPQALRALGLSILIATTVAIMNGLFGIAGALVLVRHHFPGRKVFDALVDLTLAVSPVMTGLALLLVFGRGGLVAPFFESIGIQVAFAVPGLILCTLFVTLPFTMREIAYVLLELGVDEENVATTLGASAWRTFRKVTFPNIANALRLGIVLTTARALGEFGAVLVVGGGIAGRTETATTFIYSATEERRDGAALGMALVLVVASLALLTALEWLKSRKVHT
jgi:sulfate transport system permease protein